MSTEKLQPSSAVPTSAARLPSRVMSRRLGLVFALCCGLGLLLWFSAPTLSWAWHLNRAGVLLETGLSWPVPHLADSLPTVADPALLETATYHVQQAIAARPDHPHAYRLRGRIAVAQAEWLAAAADFEKAASLQPGNPLPAWEALLAYEQLAIPLDAAPTVQLTRVFAAGTLSAPTAPLQTPFCQAENLATCYVGTTMVAMPYAHLPAATLNTRMLFVHPPASVSQTLRVPADTPALRFVVGLHPDARTWGSDGASFVVLLEDETGQRQTIYERSLDRVALAAGWYAEAVDLTRWAGQRVTLTFATTGGAQRDTTADWVGFGALVFTTPEAAERFGLVPRTLMQRAWQMTGLPADEVRQRGDEARAQGREDEALRWYRRAEWLR